MSWKGGGERFPLGLINVGGDSKSLWLGVANQLQLGSQLPLKFVLFNVGFDYKATFALYTHIKRVLKALKN